MMFSCRIIGEVNSVKRKRNTAQCNEGRSCQITQHSYQHQHPINHGKKGSTTTQVTCASFFRQAETKLRKHHWFSRVTHHSYQHPINYGKKGSIQSLVPVTPYQQLWENGSIHNQVPSACNMLGFTVRSFISTLCNIWSAVIRLYQTWKLIKDSG